MASVTDIIQWVRQQTSHDLNRDEGLMQGSGDIAISGILACWMPDCEAIQAAASLNCSLIVHHEALYFEPPPLTFFANQPIDHLAWPANVRRRELMEKYGLTALRVHGSADEICVYEAFRKQLGLGEHIAEQPGNMFRRLYEIPPTRFEDLLNHVKGVVGLDPLRHTAEDPDKIVTRVAIPWGGMALSLNSSYLAGLMDLGKVDVFIAGETDVYAIYLCKEAGVDIIETGHEVSEIEGIRTLSRLLKNAFPETHVHMYRNKKLWKWD